MNTAASVRERLEIQRKQAQMIAIAHIGVYLAAVVLIVLHLYVPAAIITGINFLIYLFLVRGQIRHYSLAVSKANVLCGLCSPLESAQFTDRVGMSMKRFQSLAVLPMVEREGSLLVRAAFSGQGYGLDLEGCEFTLHYAAPGARDKNQYRFLSGTLLTAEPRTGAWPGDWLLLRRGLLDEAAQSTFLEERGYTPFSCPDGKLNDRFQLYAGDGVQEVPQWLARRLSRAAEQSDRLGAVRLTGKQAAVYLENRFYTSRTKVRDLPNEKWLTHCPLPERDGMWELFRSLGAGEGA